MRSPGSASLSGSDLFANARPVRLLRCEDEISLCRVVRCDAASHIPSRMLMMHQDPRVANAELQAAYDEATGKPSASTSKAAATPAKAITGECAVCYEDLDDVPAAQLWTDTDGCGKGLHRECFSPSSSPRHR